MKLEATLRNIRIDPAYAHKMETPLRTSQYYYVGLTDIYICDILYPTRDLINKSLYSKVQKERKSHGT